MEQLCSDCPRNCHARRGETSGGGVCVSPLLPRVIRATPHYGEEPCISGTRGAGTIFFSGCNLRCVFCQNREISRKSVGKTLSVSELRTLMQRLRDQGVHNIELVTPTHFTRVIAEALEGLNLGIPVVWNSSGYESVETLRLLDGLVQVYMPDLKYLSAETAGRYSAAADYPEAATAAIDEMVRQRGAYRLDGNGMLQSGVHRALLPYEPVHTHARPGTFSRTPAHGQRRRERKSDPLSAGPPPAGRVLAGNLFGRGRKYSGF